MLGGLIQTLPCSHYQKTMINPKRTTLDRPRRYCIVHMLRSLVIGLGHSYWGADCTGWVQKHLKGQAVCITAYLGEFTKMAPD